MKTHNHLYEEICSFENLLAAAWRAERGKRMQDTIGRFRTHLEGELLGLRRKLVNKTYAPGPCRETIITRPKRRMISAVPFRDRVAHHAVCHVVMPLFERQTIACRDTLWLLERIVDGSNRQEPAGSLFPGDDLAAAAMPPSRPVSRRTCSRHSESRGHKFSVKGELDLYFGGAQGVMFRSDGKLLGAADPRRDGVAVGY